MVFNSIGYIIFFPIVLLCYYIVPQKLKNIWLLLASYVFYGIWNVKYCILLFVCTLITYVAGLAIYRRIEKKVNAKLSEAKLAILQKEKSKRKMGGVRQVYLPCCTASVTRYTLHI